MNNLSYFLTRKPKSNLLLDGGTLAYRGFHGLAIFFIKKILFCDYIFYEVVFFQKESNVAEFLEFTKYNIVS